MAKKMFLWMTILMMSAIHVTKGMNIPEYDNVIVPDSLAPETAEEWGLQEYLPKKDKNNRPLDLQKQLKIAKHYLYRKGGIEAIKKFHEKNKISYDDPYELSLLSTVYDGFGLVYPLDWALSEKQVDFALWLIKEKKVDVKNLSSEKYSKFHYFALGVSNKQWENNLEYLMKELIENNASINALDWYNRTPLRVYADYTDYRNGYDSKILKLFFNHGASLVVKKKDERGNVLACNNVLRELKYCEKKEINYSQNGIVQLLRSRLDAVSPWIEVAYRNQLSYAKKKYDACFIALSLCNKKLKFFKIPKPIIHMICKLAATYDENIQDIKASLVMDPIFWRV